MVGGVVAIGIVVTIVVEYVFRRVHPATDLTEGIEYRLHTVETVLRSAAAEQPLDSVSEKQSCPLFHCRYLQAAKADHPFSIQRPLQVPIGHRGCAVGAIGGRRRQFPTFSTEERAKTAGAGDLASQIDPADKARCQRLADAD